MLGRLALCAAMAAAVLCRTALATGATTAVLERPERCVWGTNWPHPRLTRFMPNDTDLLDLLESWLPDDTVRESLFARNAAKLYRLEDL